MMGKLVHGIGIYERGICPSTVNKVHTKEYILWKGMLGRCRVDGWVQTRHHTYHGCEVHPDFIKFQEFAPWCQNQIGFKIPGWHLDKDILLPGNKVYGPDTCCFVPRDINMLFIHYRDSEGGYPVGVSYNKRDNRYFAQVRINGRSKYLGMFDDPISAYNAYRIAKIKNIRELAEMWKPEIDIRVYNALLNYKMDDILNQTLQQPDAEAN